MRLASATIVEHLASQYALGQLSPLVRRRFEHYAKSRADLRAAVMRWQERLHSLATSVPPVLPTPKLWQRIDAQLFGGVEEANRARSLRDVWRAQWELIRLFFSGQLTPIKLAVVGAIGAVFAVLAMNLIFVLPNFDEIVTLKRGVLPQSYVGILRDSKEAATLLASSLRQGTKLTVKLLKPLPNETDRQYRMWAIPNDGAPFSVGLIPHHGTTTLVLPAASETLFSKVPWWVVFAEPIGSASAAPTGFPVLSGHCVKLW